MRSLPIEIIVLSGLSLLTLASVAHAAGPGQADFDSCNKEASTQAASPSAAPGGDVTKPGTPVSPSAAPTTETPSTPSPSAPAGADRASKPGTPVAPSEARASVPGASTPDDPSRGMAAAGQADPAFKRAYVECMKRRGF